jgi:hypothetical protein
MLTLLLLPNVNIICEITARVKTLNRQEIGGQTTHCRTDNILKDRQYIGGQTIH